jgi:hypothetical protein
MGGAIVGMGVAIAAVAVAVMVAGAVVAMAELMVVLALVATVAMVVAAIVVVVAVVVREGHLLLESVSMAGCLPRNVGVGAVGDGRQTRRDHGVIVAVNVDEVHQP